MAMAPAFDVLLSDASALADADGASADGKRSSSRRWFHKCAGSGFTVRSFSIIFNVDTAASLGGTSGGEDAAAAAVAVPAAQRLEASSLVKRVHCEALPANFAATAGSAIRALYSARFWLCILCVLSFVEGPSNGAIICNGEVLSAVCCLLSAVTPLHGPLVTPPVDVGQRDGPPLSAVAPLVPWSLHLCRRGPTMALRRCAGFKRYALSIQYHGAPHLGLAYQGDGVGENCILSDTEKDLRGVQSVEGRLRQALSSLVGQDNFENFRVSSRTDRGVHALMNTCHVDIRPRKRRGDGVDTTTGSSDAVTTASPWDAKRLQKGLNYFIRKRSGNNSLDQTYLSPLPLSLYRDSLDHSLRILKVLPAPLTAPNEFYTGKPDCTEPEEIDWNVRFTATSRTYCYRILHISGDDEREACIPFEYDRSWRILDDDKPLDVDAMNLAAELLIGTHDFSSFRGKGCQRLSPVVTLNDIDISSRPHSPFGLDMAFSSTTKDSNTSVNMYTICITGESFVYRQVRNIVGCLVCVGQGKITPSEVANILEKRERKFAPAMAPAHGLFLTNVAHWGLDL